MTERPWAVLSCVLLTAAVSSGDVVHLKNGRRISGEVVRQTPTEVVVKTPQGKLTFPMRIVERVEKSSAEETLLQLAQERLAAGARAQGEELLRKAAASKDPEVAAKAKAQLARLEAKDRQRAKANKGPRLALPIPAGIGGRPSEGATLQEQFDRLRRAIDYRDGPRATSLLRSLVEQNPEHRVLRYLVGRAAELEGRDSAAREAYLDSLGTDARWVREREPGWIKDLARRVAAGEVVSKETPGAGRAWHRVAGAHAVIYSRHELSARLSDTLEALAKRGRQVLDLRARESDLDGRVQIALCFDAYEVRRLGQLPPSRQVMADGVLWRHVVLAPELAAAGPGIMAEALLERAVPGTPRWAALGAAQRLQSSERRAADLSAARARYGAAPPPLTDVLEGRVALDGDPAACRGLLGLVVDLLVEERETLKKALHFATKVEPLGGAGKALARFRLDQAALEAAYAAALQE